MELPVPSPTGSVKKLEKKKLSIRGPKEKAVKMKKKGGSLGTNDQEEIGTKEGTSGSLKLAGDSREEIV